MDEAENAESGTPRPLVNNGVNLENERVGWIIMKEPRIIFDLPMVFAFRRWSHCTGNNDYGELRYIRLNRW